MKRFIPKSTAKHPFSIGVPAIIWQLLFFYIPLLIIVVTSFLDTTETGIEGVTFEKIAYFLNPLYMRVIGLSFALAITTVILCFLIAYPLAYFIAFRGKRFKNFLLFLLLIPFWTNFLLHVYAWFYVLEKHGFLNTLLQQFGMSPVLLLNSPFAIIIMMVYYYLPFMVLPIYSSLERFNTSLIEASFDLGASWFQTFRRIILPLTMRGVRAGFFLVYIPAFGEFAIPSLMGGDKIIFVGNVVSEFILAEGTGSLGAAFMVISCAILLASAVFFYWLLGRFTEPVRDHG
ncbi:MAG TPA: ABC transporter permease [Rhabdochlamydiaceae bacterium]|nr:ABC transporter permease [Rhabdochlamydiaceae bacterium]